MGRKAIAPTARLELSIEATRQLDALRAGTWVAVGPAIPGGERARKHPGRKEMLELLLQSATDEARRIEEGARQMVVVGPLSHADGDRVRARGGRWALCSSTDTHPTRVVWRAFEADGSPMMELPDAID